MIQQSVKINNKAGLYAKPVDQLVKTASRFNAEIFITYNGRKVNAKSVLGVLSLAIPKQSEIVIEVSGEDESEALREVMDTLQNAD
ncbi:HPr family phosphocarrier protein [Bacillus sp. BRMEA1]|uniref:HPr family phosphocarrier protein n=1 Tax=Neobacillus endophyticus TaxID=2738405 RepID=UPI001566CD6B|nr:HPr family phosphocarrier protein [Neobacillus endophyticus]NRD79748.1 HPr family phosphocarrier protein [Neobacillus endophyticus]